MAQVSSNYGGISGVAGVNSYVNQAPTSFDSGVYTSADERDTGVTAAVAAANSTSAAASAAAAAAAAAAAVAATPPVPLERGRSSLRRGPLPSVRYAAGGATGAGVGGGVGGGAESNNPSYNFQQVV